MPSLRPTISLLLLLTSSTLLVDVVHGDCSYSKNFIGSADGVFNMSSFALPDFYVAEGATTTCTTTCDTGSDTTMYLLYGNFAGPSDFDGSDSNPTGCDMSVSISSPDPEYKLGVSVSIWDPFDNFEVTCTCTQVGSPPPPSPAPSNSIPCFSDQDTVDVLDERGVVAMKDLQVGDMVRTGTNQYEKVYSFGHRHESSQGRFVQFHTTANTGNGKSNNNNKPLEISPNHLIHVIKASGEEEVEHGRAGTVHIGDRLIQVIGDDDDDDPPQEVTVTKVNSVTRTGLYMPLTASGTIVVNGILASAYVSMEDEVPRVVEHASRYYGFSDQQLMHWFLAPYRMLCLGVSSKFGNTSNGSADNDSDDDEGIPTYLLLGKFVAEIADESWSTRVLHLLGVALFLFYGLLILMETVFGPAYAPTALFFVCATAFGAFRTLAKGRNAALMARGKKSV